MLSARGRALSRRRPSCPVRQHYGGKPVTEDDGDHLADPNESVLAHRSWLTELLGKMLYPPRPGFIALA